MSSKEPPLIPVSRVLALGALAVLALTIIQVGNAVRLPFGDWFCSPTGSLFSSGALSDFMGKYGYLSLFILMTAESASAPIPSEVVLPIAGVLVSEGVLSSLPLALMVGTAAALIGALADYYLARALGRPFVAGVLRIFHLESSKLDRAERWFEKSGRWTVFAARFVPYVRALISLPAGLFRMSLLPFIGMTVVGCIVWNGILLYAGYALGSACAGPSRGLVIDGFALAAAAASTAYLLYFAVKARATQG